MEIWAQSLLYFAVGIISGAISSFVAQWLIIKYKNSKKRFNWVLQNKLELSFLITPFDSDEIKNQKIKGDEIKLIISFHKHFCFFHDYIIEMGYLNKKQAEIWKKDFLNGILRSFLVKFEKYNNEKYKNEEKKLTEKEKQEIFKNLSELKDKVKDFYKSNIKNNKKESEK